MASYSGVLNEHNLDINIHSFGFEDNGKIAHWGPGARNFYILHYVVSGKGYFNSNAVEKGQGFFICKNELHEYHADGCEPWNYFWIIFSGLKASEMYEYLNADENGIFSFALSEKFLSEMKKVFSQSTVTEFFALGAFFEFISFHKCLIKKKYQSVRELRVKKVKNYIDNNYHVNIKIADIAKKFYIDSAYLYNIFVYYEKVSPKEYLNSVRIKKACTLLRSTNLSVGEIAVSVGYEDALRFSAFFKTHMKISPSAYRKQSDIV